MLTEGGKIQVIMAVHRTTAMKSYQPLGPIANPFNGPTVVKRSPRVRNLLADRRHSRTTHRSRLIYAVVISSSVGR